MASGKTGFFVCFAASIAAAQTPLLQPESGFHETFQTTVPVGGHVFAGAELIVGQAPSTDEPANLAYLQISLPPPGHSSHLCIALHSLDGNYEGNGSYNITSKPSGDYLLVFPQNYGKALTRYKLNAVAALAWLQDRCDLESAVKSGLRVVPLRWGIHRAPEAVALQLNVLGQDVQITSSGPGGLTSSCQGVNSQSLPLVSFDTTCHISVLQSGWYESVLRRWSFEKALPPVTFYLWTP